MGLNLLVYFVDLNKSDKCMSVVIVCKHDFTLPQKCIPGSLNYLDFYELEIEIEIEINETKS